MRENQFTYLQAPVQETEQSQKSEIISDKRQQDKIVAVLESGNFDRISENQIDVPDNRREEFLKKVAKGEINEAKFLELISNIKPPIAYEQDQDNPAELYGFVSGNKQMRGLIAEFARGDFNQRDILNPKDLAVFLKKYPEPSAFEQDVQGFLYDIEQANSPSKRQEYEASLREFMHIVYDKRQEYYEQSELLRTEADAKYPELAKDRARTDGRLAIRQETDMRKGEQLKNARQELENFQIETIEDNDAEKILERVEVHGDDFMGEILTPEILKAEGLLPKHKIRIGDSVVWFSSSSYELTKGRVAVVAYVEKESKVTARSYYRSNSQGVWRYLPDYKMSEDGEIDWYGKGRSEESITLPVVMQKALSEITREDMPVLKLKKNPDFIFAGTAQKYGKFDGDYYREIEARPRRLEGEFYPKRGKTPPEQVRLSSEQSPDFSKLLTSWRQKTSVYGEVAVELFPSRDGTLKFMFCKDAGGRVWIGGIEDNSENQSTGLKKSWIEGGDLVTPAYEYKTDRVDQTGGYGNDKMRYHNYVDMYEDYLKKIPVIQEYLNASAAHQP